MAAAAPRIAAGDHEAYMRYALSLAERSPPKPTNFRVGAVLVDPASHRVLATGYTLELAGNTHAEQCCFLKLAQQHGVDEAALGAVLPPCVLYTTMEPCTRRLSGHESCTQRILRIGPAALTTVYVGVEEPQKFVGDNNGRAVLERAGVGIVHVAGLEDEILAVATAGHT